MSSVKKSIVLVRHIVPNFWEIKPVDGDALPLFEPAKWKAIPRSSNFSVQDIQSRLPDCTVLDVTDHYRAQQPSLDAY